MGRAYHHDYRRKGVYHITVKKDAEMPAFGWLSGKLPKVYIRRSSLGLIIARHIYAIPTLNPLLRVLQYTVMPDHIHFLLHVLDTLDRHLGNYIGMFKVKITQEYERHTGVKHSVFEEDFDDCIIYPSRSLDVVYDYIRDNPRRLAERVENPDFFQRINELVIDGLRCQAYGNIQLLANPFKEQVVVHRADTADQREANRQRWLYTASNGGVLVSPFISRAEKAIRDDAEANNGRFILITNESFGERYKPAAHNFDLCAAGRLLIISVPSIAPTTRDQKISRTHCLLLNRLSVHITNMPATSRYL